LISRLNVYFAPVSLAWILTDNVSNNEELRKVNTSK